MNPATLSRNQTEKVSAKSWWARQNGEILIALVLMLASHFFVSCFVQFPRWEHHMPAFTRNDFCKWDCGWYSSIETKGYESTPRAHDQPSWHFLPMFPISVYPLNHLLKMSAGRASVLMSKFFLFTGIWAFLWMLRDETPAMPDKWLAGTLVAFNPYLLYAHVGYSESLYFTLAACALAALKRECWVISGFAAGLLSATRMQGIVFIMAYLVGCIRRFGIGGVLRQKNLNVWLGLFLCPIGLSLYFIYLYHLTGDALAPVHSFVAWGIRSGNPLQVLIDSIRQGGWQKYWAGTAIAGLIAAVWLAFQRKLEMAVFLALCIVMPMSAEVAGMPRFVWWQPPTLYVVYRTLQRFRNLRMIYATFVGGVAAVTIYLWMVGSASVL